ncbi:MAG: 50S ribosomal protein L29 [Candidatus Bipolaricaulis sp.]|nr:50S ribosomal protein L29 [Candidatus Bipolaricaulis sp.]MDD5219326.1 50S ribosomal protein L29 [Candidatus Bipolaricaulis sp.]MDD5646412.1 50S ribosomal protein L29 [Candidatus Bipolaricaulis sp.]
MKAGELREMTLAELEQKERELKRKLFNLRFQRATGQLDNSAELKKTRRDVARVMTVAAAKGREAGR